MEQTRVEYLRNLNTINREKRKADLERTVLQREKLIEMGRDLNSNDQAIARINRAIRENSDYIEFLRENDPADTEHRTNLRRNFDKAINEAIPDNCPVVFHGTSNIGTVREIIRTGGLLTPEEKGEDYSSFATQIDVTSKRDIHVSLDFAESGADKCMPYGAIFAFMPLQSEEEEVFKCIRTGSSEVAGGVAGVRFIEEPDRLVAIITTEENIERVSAWCREYGWPEGRVMTHENFLTLCQNKLHSNSNNISN